MEAYNALKPRCGIILTWKSTIYFDKFIETIDRTLDLDTCKQLTLDVKGIEQLPYLWEFELKDFLENKIRTGRLRTIILIFDGLEINKADLNDLINVVPKNSECSLGIYLNNMKNATKLYNEYEGEKLDVHAKIVTFFEGGSMFTENINDSLSMK